MRREPHESTIKSTTGCSSAEQLPPWRTRPAKSRRFYGSCGGFVDRLHWLLTVRMAHKLPAWRVCEHHL